MQRVVCDGCPWILAELEDRAEREKQIYSGLMRKEMEYGKMIRGMFQWAERTARLNDLNDALVYLGKAAWSYFGDDGASGCFNAVRLLEMGIVACEHGQSFSLDYIFLKNEIRVLCKKVRDSLIVRTQLGVVIGDKAVFEDALNAAYGEVIDKKSQLYSLLMQSYKKQIWEAYPDEAFGSSNVRANKARGKTREGRSRV